MSSSPARTFPEEIVTARCIDCDLDFTGPLGVRFVQADGMDLEVVVHDSKRNEIHTIARVDIYLVPVAREPIAPLPPSGSA
jgi:hypothetical protein